MPIKILLVDDDLIDTGWIDSCLKASRGPFFLTTVDTLSKALIHIQKKSTDVVLLDARLMKSYLNKIDAIDFRVERPPIIALGDWQQADIELESLDQGVSDVLPKPFLTPLLLSHSIRYALKNFSNEKQLMQLAYYDTLTGAANRRLFMEHFKLLISQIKRNKGAAALILIDLDEFKPINDQYGHDAGDQVLKIFVKRVNKVIRDADTLARLGGDEFAILLWNIESIENAEIIAKKILRALRTPLRWKGNKLGIKASLGIAFFPSSEIKLSSKSVYKSADTALYKAKESGKSMYCIYGR